MSYFQFSDLQKKGETYIDESKQLLDNIKRTEIKALKDGIKQKLFRESKELKKALGFVGTATEEPHNTHNIKIRTSTNPQLAGVQIILYTPKGKKIGHYVTAIDRGDHIEYYNPTGRKIDESPIKDIFKKEVRGSAFTHQEGGSIVCERHSIARACYKHLTNDQYNELIEAGRQKYKLSSDAIITGITNQAVKSGFVKTPATKPFKKGGIVSANK